jgi:hypothetical protein
MNLNKILLVAGVILAVYAVLLVGAHLYQGFYGKSCPVCQPFTGTAVREGDALLLVVRHVPCEPAECHPCGASTGAIQALNISVLPDGGEPFFIEPAVKVNEAILIPGALANGTGSRVTASVRFPGWQNATCNLTVVDTRV